MSYNRGITTDLAQPDVPEGRGTAGFKGTSKVDGDQERFFEKPLVKADPGDEGEVLTSTNDPGVPWEAAAAVGVGTVQVVARTLTAAEVQTLDSDPIDLVPAAAGRLYWPVGGIVVYHPGAIPFDISVVSLLAIGSQYTLLMSIDMTLGFLAGSEAFAIAIPLEAPTNLALADSTNEALRFSADADMPDGDGTLDVTVLYREVDVS